MKKLRNRDGRPFDGHDFDVDDNDVGYLSVVPCREHRVDAFRNRADHAKRDVPTRSKR